MNARTCSATLALMTWLVAPAAFADDGVPANDSPVTVATDSGSLAAPAAPIATDTAALDSEPPVIQYDLSGPRIGVTFEPKGGGTRSQFGWHSENQAAPGTRGPWFIVERVFLIGGVENSQFIPSGTLIFGMRLPNSFEFGVGPSLGIGPGGFSTSVVAAAGQTLRFGGIRVPMNAAVAMNHEGYRVSLVTGWAIRDPSSRR